MAKHQAEFNALCEKDVDEQSKFFMKSFIFALDNEWKEVEVLSKKFKKYIDDARIYEEGVTSLNAAQAADFLQQNGKTRTGVQRKEELRDVDLNMDDRISFLEYLLLHYKAMILREYYKRHQTAPEEDLSNDAIGVTGVGDKLLEELFTFPVGLNKELEDAIEAFYASKKARESRYKELSAIANGAGVKAFAAKNEMAQMDSQDTTEMNRLELTLNAAKRKAQKTSADQLMAQKLAAAEKEEKDKRDASRGRLAAMAARFEQQ